MKERLILPRLNVIGSPSPAVVENLTLKSLGLYQGLNLQRLFSGLLEENASCPFKSLPLTFSLALFKYSRQFQDLIMMNTIKIRV